MDAATDDQIKKAKLDPDAMNVDSGTASTGGAATTFVSLKTATTAESASVTDKEILKGLRPIVLALEPFSNKESLCTFLEALDFLQVSPSIRLETIDSILTNLSAIYKEVRRRVAEKVPKDGDVRIRDLAAIIEIRNAVLHSRPVQTRTTKVKIYEHLVPDLQNPGKLTRVIVRHEDKAFWDRCIELSLKGHKVCGVGNPGIGKTTTALYLLQKIIVNQKEHVVYTIRQPSGLLDVYYEFIPVVENEEVKDVNVKVYRISNAEKTSKIPSLKKQDAFYVVDPGNFPGSCDDTSELPGIRFIMAASNDSKHWGGNNFTKNRAPAYQRASLDEFGPSLEPGKLVYGCLWTGYQLLAAKPYFDALRILDDDEILRRLRIVGGCFRDILELDETKFTQDVSTALNLDTSTVQELAEGRYQFAFDKAAPSCVLIGVGPHDGNMELYIISLKSDYVEERLAEKYLRMSWYKVLDEDNAGNRGNLFESFLRLKFSTGPVDFTKEQVRESKREKPPNARKNVKQNYQPVDSGLTLGGKRTIVRVSNMNDYVQKDQAKQYMYYSKNESEPLIDMISRVDDGYNSFQATTSFSHIAEPEQIRALKRELNLKPGETLRIFFVVPSSRYQNFVTHPVNPLLDQQDLTDVSIYHVGIMDE